jgi:2-furoate---CoA ligase
MQTLYDLVWNQADRSPDHPALVDDRTDRRLTYRELIAEIDRVAAGFAARGIVAGDRVATCLPSVWEHALSVLALQRIGAVPALINARLKPAEVAKLVERADMRGAVVMAQPELAGAVAAVLPGAAGLLTVALGPAGDGAVPGAVPGADFANCVGAPAALPPVPRPDPEDPCMIFYTSGTTGLPKAAVLPHRTSEHRIVWLSTQAGLRHGPHTRALGFMPLAHCIGFYGVFLVTLGFGGTYHMMSSFDPAAAVDAVEKHAISYTFAAPTLYHAMVNAPNYAPERMRSLALVLYGGSIIPEALIGHMATTWENATIRHIYGTTETMCSGYNPDPVGDPHALRPGYYTRARYVRLGGDPDDVIGPGEEGELIIAADSDTMFTEYLNRPDATAEKLRDGWYYTGDVIAVDERGYFSLRGRADDMVKSGGENIHPGEIEDVLRTAPGVEDCCAIGLPDDRWGQIVVGCVVPKDGTALDPVALDTHFKASPIAGFKRPKGYYVAAEIPRNPGNGNVLRRLLRGPAEAARASGAAAWLAVGG